MTIVKYSTIRKHICVNVLLIYISRVYIPSSDILRNKRELSARQVAGHMTESRPSMDAILEASQVGFDDSSLESPLVNSLKPKRVWEMQVESWLIDVQLK